MSERHTPGPWHLTAGVGVGMRYTITSTESPDPNKPFVVGIVAGYADHTEANARLIAAAPKMLRALLYARGALTAFWDLEPAATRSQMPGYPAIMADINEAIADARGEGAR